MHRFTTLVVLGSLAAAAFVLPEAAAAQQSTGGIDWQWTDLVIGVVSAVLGWLSGLKVGQRRNGNGQR